MTKENRAAGIGGVAFGVLFFAAMMIANGPGGNYSASEVTAFNASGHRLAVFVALYAALFACGGLVALLAGLRGTITGTGTGTGHAGQVFWGCGLAGATALAVGWALVSTVPMSMTLGGGKAFDPKVMYAFDQAGLVVVFAAGGVLLGVSLIALAIASTETLPKWMRTTTAVAGVLGLASPAFFPFFVLLLWSLTAGVWTLTSTRQARPSPTAQPIPHPH